jgi:hypothetical protein
LNHGLSCLLLALVAGYANAGIVVRLSESSEEVKVVAAAGSEGCTSGFAADAYGDSPGFRKASDRVFLRKLNSEKELGKYLVAARLGGGIYLHLPYFHPGDSCGEVSFEIEGRKILWNGKLYSGKLRIPERDVFYNSVFFTNEPDADISDAIYFDRDIPAPALRQLKRAFPAIADYYRKNLAVEAVQSTSAVVALVHNQGKYVGYGGDALNIIRITYDNPNPLPADIAGVFSDTYAHELAHKAQHPSLFENPHGRYLTEGSAEFLKLFVLRESGLIDARQQDGLIRNALQACAKHNAKTSWLQKLTDRTIFYREPYDCGLVYYVASYRSSGLEAKAFVALLLKALSADIDYSTDRRQLCLLYEADCENLTLTDLVSGGPRFDRRRADIESTKPLDAP